MEHGDFIKDRDHIMGAAELGRWEERKGQVLSSGEINRRSAVTFDGASVPAARKEPE